MTFPLVCSICHKPYTGEDVFSCPFCSGSIEVDYDLAAKKEELRTIIKQGGHSGIWCYKKLLPVNETIPPISLFEGNTPLLHAENLERLIGCGPLYLKNETANPSGAYKDRFSSVAITWQNQKMYPLSLLVLQATQPLPYQHSPRKHRYHALYFYQRVLFANAHTRPSHMAHTLFSWKGRSTIVY